MPIPKQRFDPAAAGESVFAVGNGYVGVRGTPDEGAFALLLVNPQHAKQVPGRKTDVQDCQWLQELHTYGLLRGAFRPEDEVCVLRSYLRQRRMLVAMASRAVQHLQKALEDRKLTPLSAEHEYICLTPTELPSLPGLMTSGKDQLASVAATVRMSASARRSSR